MPTFQDDFEEDRAPVGLETGCRERMLIFDQLASFLSNADLVIVATPMAGLRGLLVQLRHCHAPVAILPLGNRLCKSVAIIGFLPFLQTSSIAANPNPRGQTVLRHVS